MTFRFNNNNNNNNFRKFYHHFVIIVILFALKNIHNEQRDTVDTEHDSEAHKRH